MSKVGPIRADEFLAILYFVKKFSRSLGVGAYRGAVTGYKEWVSTRYRAQRLFRKEVFIRFNGKFPEKQGTTLENGLYLITALCKKSIEKAMFHPFQKCSRIPENF